jgi:hypothetical protein
MQNSGDEHEIPTKYPFGGEAIAVQAPSCQMNSCFPLGYSKLFTAPGIAPSARQDETAASALAELVACDPLCVKVLAAGPATPTSNTTRAASHKGTSNLMNFNRIVIVAERLIVTNRLTPSEKRRERATSI